jgi:hypothetical protein
MSVLRLAKKRLSQCEGFLSLGLRRQAPWQDAKFEKRFAAPLRDLVSMLRRGGFVLPPREMARLVRLEGILSKAADRDTVTQTEVAAAVRIEASEEARGVDGGRVSVL